MLPQSGVQAVCTDKLMVCANFNNTALHPTQHYSSRVKFHQLTPPNAVTHILKDDDAICMLHGA